MKLETYLDNWADNLLTEIGTVDINGIKLIQPDLTKYWKQIIQHEVSFQVSEDAYATMKMLAGLEEIVIGFHYTGENIKTKGHLLNMKDWFPMENVGEVYVLKHKILADVKLVSTDKKYFTGNFLDKENVKYYGGVYILKPRMKVLIINEWYRKALYLLWGDLSQKQMFIIAYCADSFLLTIKNKIKWFFKNIVSKEQAN